MIILLIGNGFDLEHNLPTSYMNFLYFCEKAKFIFTSIISSEKNKSSELDNWDIHESIKDTLLSLLEGRMHIEKSGSNGTAVFMTSNVALNELYTLICDNIWLEFFLNRSSKIGKNRIDFESEISKVVQEIDSAQLSSREDLMKTLLINPDYSIPELARISRRTLEDIFENRSSTENFVSLLDKDLQRLTRALEIYIAEFVEKIEVTHRNPDIEKINPDHILSFNYSNTFERVYGGGQTITYDYIHGKADVDKKLNTSNIVLGIDEFLDKNRKNTDLQFLSFKKYYQRIFKSTGNDYLNWADIIKADEEEYQRKVERHNEGKPNLPRTGLEGVRFIRVSDIPRKQHELYIFGHSLDVTDGDVLRRLICNDNLQTKIFYYRKAEDDKSALGRAIQNLIRIIGQDELIRRTGGASKTIEFIPQTLTHTGQRTDQKQTELVGH